MQSARLVEQAACRAGRWTPCAPGASTGLCACRRRRDSRGPPGRTVCRDGCCRLKKGQIGDVLNPGQVVAHYEVEDVAGSGGTGIVYRAHDVRRGRRVALKVLSPQLAGDATTRERIGLETMVVAALDHPNVLPLFDADEADGVLYLASQWVAGRDVGTLVAQKGPLAVEEAVRIVTEVASALHAAHRVGVVHRGVKPSNVLVANDGHVYVSGFGIAPNTSDRTGVSGTEPLSPQWSLKGTLEYASPEQIRGECVDARADVYGLGGLLAFALSGRVRLHREGHPANLHAQLSADPPASPGGRRDVPEKLDAVIRRSMARDPDDRYQSVHAALAALDKRRAPPAAPAAVRTPTSASASHKPPPPAPVPARPAPAPAASAADGVRRRRSPDARQGFRTPRARRRRWAGSPRSEAPIALRRRRARSPRSPKVFLLALIPALAVLALIPAVVLLSGAREEKPGPETVEVTRSARDAAVIAGRVWIASAQSSRVVGVPLDNLEGRRREIDFGARVRAIAAHHDRLAVLAGPSLVTLLGADSRRTRRLVLPVTGSYVALGPAATWVASSRDRVLLRIEDDVARRIVLSSPASDLALGRRVLLVAHADEGLVSSIDVRTGALRRGNRVGGRPEALAITERAVWIADAGRDAVLRLDPSSGRTDAPIPVGGDPVAIAADGREVWVARHSDHAVTRIDARTGRILGEIETASRPVSLALARDAAWIVGLRGELTRVPRAGH